MGAEIPKQFIEVDGCPVIVYTFRAIERNPLINRIQVVCVAGWENTVAEYAQKFQLTKPFGIVTAGNTRYLSTRRGMESLEGVADDDVIVVHDSVRPLVTAESLTDTLDVCRRYGNAMSVIDCVDTMYERTADGYTAREINRAGMVRGQTPEAVTGRRMREMYAASDAQNIRLDSVSALQLALGWDIHFAKGSERNIKITRPEDIELFRAVVTSTKDVGKQ